MMLFVFTPAVTDARQASVQERLAMSVSIADYIHYHNYYGKTNPFKTEAVELGAAATEGRFALADWRSADDREHGQASFYTVCDTRFVGTVSTGRPLTTQNLVGQPKLESSVPAPIAAKLVAEVAQLEDLHIAYLKPAQWGTTC
ncbi:MAG TPA: hypothetical protein VKF82_07030 [Candidatus Eremiobacteraceae bacterium]|nr:hypothetical protein [Candidatus Eremiobacteraceae bacterium]